MPTNSARSVSHVSGEKCNREYSQGKNRTSEKPDARAGPSSRSPIFSEAIVASANKVSRKKDRSIYAHVAPVSRKRSHQSMQDH